MRQSEGGRVGDRFLWRSKGAVTSLGCSISDCTVTDEPGHHGLKFKHLLYELTEADGKRKTRPPLCSSSNDRQVLCRIWHVNQFLFSPFSRSKFKLQTVTIPHNVSVNHWRQRKSGCAATGKGLMSSRLSLMQIVRKIRLPVSEVVNGSHCSPTLTVDGKCRYES